MEKEIVYTDNAPQAMGPYVQAQIIGDLVFTSGQIPLVHATGELITEIKSDYKTKLRKC